MKAIGEALLTLVILVVSIIASPIMTIISGTVSHEKRSEWNRQANAMSGMED